MFVLIMVVIAFSVVMHWKDTIDEIDDLHAALRFHWLRFSPCWLALPTATSTERYSRPRSLQPRCCRLCTLYFLHTYYKDLIQGPLVHVCISAYTFNVKLMNQNATELDLCLGLDKSADLGN